MIVENNYFSFNKGENWGSVFEGIAQCCRTRFSDTAESKTAHAIFEVIKIGIKKKRREPLFNF